MLSLWQSFLQWVYSAGYPGIFAAMVLEGMGVPFPGDVFMAFYGFLASQGYFFFFLVWICATVGCYGGSLLAFYLGRRYGLSFLMGFARIALVRPRHIARTESLSRRYGVFVLVLGRFLPGVRTLSSYFAAIGGMSWLTFLIFSLVGFFAWCLTWVSLGYLLGEHWQDLMEIVNQFLFWISAFLLLLLFFVFLRRQRS